MAGGDLNDAKTKPRRGRFIEKPREPDCDEDEDRFNETLKRIVPKNPDERKGEQSASVIRAHLFLARWNNKAWMVGLRRP